MSDGSQQIVGEIAPDAGALLINVNTERPARPVYTVWRNLTNVQEQDMVPANQVAAALETLTPTTDHMKRIADLPQGVPLWLRIQAQAEDLPVSDPRGAAEFVSGTGTFFRICLVNLLSIEVLNSGDPGGGADMLFQFQVYNGSSSVGEALIDLFQKEVSDIDNGAFVPDMPRTFKIEHAPDVVVPYLSSLHHTLGFLQFPKIGTRIGDTLPAPPPRVGSNDEAEFADCMGPVTLPTTLGDTTSSAFIMGTGLAVPSITSTLQIETIVSNPSNILPVKEIQLIHF